MFGVGFEVYGKIKQQVMDFASIRDTMCVTRLFKIVLRKKNRTSKISWRMYLIGARNTT